MGLCLVNLVLQVLRFRHEDFAFQHVPQRDEDTVQIKRFLNEIVSSFLQRLHGRLDRAVSRDHDDGRLNPLLCQHIENIQPVHLGHLDIAKDGTE